MWPCARLSVASGRFCPAGVGRATGGEAAVTRRAEQGVMRRRSIMAFAGPRQSILGPRPAPGLDPPGQRLPRRASACRRSRMFRSTGHRPPPGEAKALSPLQWQGPLPLPQRHADPWPAGGQSPRPAPDPPMAGASPPPGRALAFRVPGPAGLRGTVSLGRGKRGSRFLVPPVLAKALSPLQRQGQSPLPYRPADSWPAGGRAGGSLRVFAGTVLRQPQFP